MHPHTRLALLDVGTGSGNLAISLAQTLPQAQVWAVDCAYAALQVARHNAQRLGVAERLHWVCSDLLTAFQDVEDQLVAVRILSQQRTQQNEAVAAAERSLSVAQDLYKYGVNSYLNVITAQTMLLSRAQPADGAGAADDCDRAARQGAPCRSPGPAAHWSRPVAAGPPGSARPRSAPRTRRFRTSLFPSRTR